MMPYMVGDVSEIEKALYLRKFGVPYEALSYVFGHHDMYWYRIEMSLGRFDVVGTTIQDATDLPAHIASDEKHTRQLGHRVYACLTTTADCVLGAAMSQKADTTSLKQAYGDFQRESQALNPTYEPLTNNRDGWKAGLEAFGLLFSNCLSILCFLHQWLKIKTKCRALKKRYKAGVSYMKLVGDKVWDIYHAPTKEDFETQIKAFRQWIKDQIDQDYIAQCLGEFCDKAPTLVKAYSHPQCLRTSNAVDRPMKRLDRFLFNIQYFHGHLHQAHLMIRAWALIYNFAPYNRKTQKKHQATSPAHKINRFTYHDNWLQNLLVSASLNGNNKRNRTIPQIQVE